MMKSAAILPPSIARDSNGALSHTSVAKAITARFMSGINAPGEEKMGNSQVYRHTKQSCDKKPKKESKLAAEEVKAKDEPRPDHVNSHRRKYEAMMEGTLKRQFRNLRLPH